MSSLHSIVTSETLELHYHDLQVPQKTQFVFLLFRVKFSWYIESCRKFCLKEVCPLFSDEFVLLFSPLKVNFIDEWICE